MAVRVKRHRFFLSAAVRFGILFQICLTSDCGAMLYSGYGGRWDCYFKGRHNVNRLGVRLEEKCG